MLRLSYNAGKDDSNNIKNENMLPLNRLQTCLYFQSCALPVLSVPSLPCKKFGGGKRGEEKSESQKMQRRFWPR